MVVGDRVRPLAVEDEGRADDPQRQRVDVVVDVVIDGDVDHHGGRAILGKVADLSGSEESGEATGDGKGEGVGHEGSREQRIEQMANGRRARTPCPHPYNVTGSGDFATT